METGTCVAPVQVRTSTVACRLTIWLVLPTGWRCEEINPDRDPNR